MKWLNYINVVMQIQHNNGFAVKNLRGKSNKRNNRKTEKNSREIHTGL